MPQPVLLTDEEVAEILDCHRKTVSRLRRRGDLPFVRVGRNVRVLLSEVEAYIARGGLP